jgi:hypothetical protein
MKDILREGSLKQARVKVAVIKIPAVCISVKKINLPKQQFKFFRILRKY